MNTALVNFDLSTVNPALQTTKTMSRHYQVMDTRVLVDEILKLNMFEVVSISTKKARKGKDTVGRGIHIVKLRSLQVVEIEGDKLKPEIVIMNSYDGTCPLKVYVGIYRIVCSNGLVIATKEFGQFSVRHMGTPAEAAFEVAMGFLDQLKIVVDKQKEMSQILLTDEQIEDFTRAAVALRWNGVKEDASLEGFANVLRPEDEGNSLWTVYNRVQEALTIGAVKLEGMKRKGRPIKSAVADTVFNQKLFELAESYTGVMDIDYEEVN